MANMDASYYILEALSVCEMTGYDLTRALHANGHPIDKGDGFLYPVLLLMEQGGLVRRISEKTASGDRHLYYGVTPLGLYHYKKERAKHILSQFDPEETGTQPTKSATKTDLSISALPAYLTTAVPGRKTRRRFLAEYTAHFAAARAAGEEDAAILAAFGEVSAISDALTDAATAYEKRVKVKPRTWVLLGVGTLVVALISVLWILWGEFVPQCLAIIGSILAVFYIYRLTRTYIKRRRAYRLIKRVAEECGYTYTKHQSVASSLRKVKAAPAITVKAGNTVYKIRFVAAQNRRKILKFRSPYLYQIFTQRGIALARTHRSPLAIYFKPPQMSSKGVFSLYHTYLVEFDGPINSVPVYEKRNDSVDFKHAEVLLFNPVPMRVEYLKSGETTLAGGETHDGVLLHDAPGFSEYLRRTKK